MNIQIVTDTCNYFQGCFINNTQASAGTLDTPPSPLWGLQPMHLGEGQDSSLLVKRIAKVSCVALKYLY